MIEDLRLRLAAWLAPKPAPVDHVAALANVDELERAIDLVAEAMPNGSTIPGLDDIEYRKAVLRGIIDGKSATIACDWDAHPTHVVVATPQANGRALFTIHERSEFLQKGSQ